MPNSRPPIRSKQAEQQLYQLAETGGVSSGFVPFADALQGAVVHGRRGLQA